jgi:hypothetical protein
VSRHLSTAGDRLALVVTDTEAEAGPAEKMPNYVTEDGYVAVRDVRTRVNRNGELPQQVCFVPIEGPSPVDFATCPASTMIRCAPA